MRIKEAMPDDVPLLNTIRMPKNVKDVEFPKANYSRRTVKSKKSATAKMSTKKATVIPPNTIIEEAENEDEEEGEYYEEEFEEEIEEEAEEDVDPEEESKA